MAKDGDISKWDDFNTHVMNVGPDFFGFAEIAEVNRFAARYRAANCFEEIRLRGFSNNTQAGYSALCRLLLVYSAFEAYLRIAGLKQNGLSKALAEFGADDVLDRIRKIDSNDRFYNFIYQRVNEAHKKELDSYFNTDACNIAYLASAIRHIFAHGWLSPSANGNESSNAAEICNVLSDFLLRFMDYSFAQSVDQGMKEIYGS